MTPTMSGSTTTIIPSGDGEHHFSYNDGCFVSLAMLAARLTLEHIRVPLEHIHLLTRRTTCHDGGPLCGDDGSSPAANHPPMKYDGSF
jgi:hypothetical protein